MNYEGENTEKGTDVMERGTLLNRMTNRIRQSLELQDILEATVVEMRAYLNTDRVKIYCFQLDGTGQVIAESVNQNRLPSLLNLHFPAGDIPPYAREMFVKARQRCIVDIPAQTITLSYLDCPDTTGDLTVADVRNQAIKDILQRPVDPCHVQYLTSMGVQSSLVVPIIHGKDLWGLLVSHHAQKKAFSQEQLELVQMLADQVAIAISQSHLLSQSREKVRREAAINQVSILLHSPLRTDEILQIVLEKIVLAVGGSGGRLYLMSTDEKPELELYTYGVQPNFPDDGDRFLLEDYPLWQQLISEFGGGIIQQHEVIKNWIDMVIGAGNDREAVTINSNLLLQPRAVADLYKEPQMVTVAPLFRSTRIRSLLVMPLQYGGQSLGCLTIFQDEIDTDIIWAGKFNPDERQQRVRDSFEAWRELKRGQAREWMQTEIDLVRSLSTHLTMAVMQNLLYQCERKQRLIVEWRNRELKLARSVAEEANRLKSNFLSSTSHELRTPLASTLNYLKLLKEGFYDNEEELKEYIDIAHQSAENLVAIINDVLDLAKIEAGRINLNQEIVNLPSLLEEQRNLFRSESRREGISLIIECEIKEVYADDMRLKQVLTNLLSNAFKFTAKGEIRIKAIPTDLNLVEISVADSGIGIDITKQELVFDPFVQADGSIRRRYGGTGLGLTICKQLVELMDGQIWLKSLGKGQGTVVSFTLPRTAKN